MAKAIVGYIRVSTARQGKSGSGWKRSGPRSPGSPRPRASQIVAEFVEVETGKGSDALDRRPQLAAALAEARKRKCAVIVAKLDRLSAATCISFPA